MKEDEIRIGTYSTKTLVDELVTRTGVERFDVEPLEEYQVRADSEERPRVLRIGGGPVVILVIED